MCGLIVAIGDSIETRVFEGLLDRMSHRGPDHRAIVEDIPGVSIGHCRLSIQGLKEDSNQPLQSKSGQHIIAFNGEIYNFKQLAKRFKIELSSGSDTELLVELYEKLGPPMLHELVGMFAFVIVNKQTKNFFVARDRLGVKPLYTSEVGGRLVFASEISPILDLQNSSKFDDFAIRQYRSLRGFFNGRTPYVGVEMFPPGTFQIGMKREKFWELKYRELQPPDDDELESLLHSAINLRTVADVEIGSFLSGGVDSAYISKVAKVRNTWSVGTSNENEFVQASESAAHMGTIHTNLEISSKDFLETAREMIQKRKEPLAVPNEVLLYLLSKTASSTNKVLLSGEGADELFYGYNRIFEWAASESTLSLETFGSHYAYERGTNDLELFEDAISPYAKFGTPIQVVRGFFQTSHLQGLLRRLDNSTMLAGVEGRAPFTDHRLVDRIFSSRYEPQSSGCHHKLQFRRIARRVLPEGIAFREKVGFPVSFDKILHEVSSELGAGVSSKGYSAWFDFNLSILGYKSELE